MTLESAEGFVPLVARREGHIAPPSIADGTVESSHFCISASRYLSNAGLTLAELQKRDVTSCFNLFFAGSGTRMSKLLLTPAFLILRRLSFFRSFVLLGCTFVLPMLVCLVFLGPWGGGIFAIETVVAIVFVLTATAFYTLAGVYAYMNFGVNRLIRVADRIAAGELVNSRENIGDNSRNDDASRLWASILKMNTSLRDIVRQVRSSAETIVFSAHDITEGNNHLAQRTQEQATSLEQTASGMEELAATAQQNAADCARASTLVAQTRSVAGSAAAQMQDVATTMQHIDDSSRRVSDILGAVEGIAFQTNILALNAAVEAARAGDQGRGFAVVANEVRSLAHRSAVAAKEIKALMTESTERVSQGRQFVESAQATISEAVLSVQAVTDLISGIALASSEQSAGIEAINHSVVQIDTANQQNAALVEEASAAAASFEGEATRLMEVVGRFKVDRETDRGRVVSLVKQGASHVLKHGVQRACADFNDRAGKFVQGEYYIFALDLHGKRLAYAPDPSVVGQNGLDMTDSDGRYFGREINALARANGSGWCDFKFLNPKTGRIEPKSVYIERVQDIILGCGIYEGRHAETAASGNPRSSGASAPFPRLAAVAR